MPQNRCRKIFVFNSVSDLPGLFILLRNNIGQSDGFFAMIKYRLHFDRSREYGGQLPEGGLKPDMLIFYLIDPSTKQNNVFAINERKYLKCIGSGRMGWERAGPWLVHVGSMHLGINMMVWWSCLHLHNSKITPYKYRSCPFTETTASTVITNILSLSS